MIGEPPLLPTKRKKKHLLPIPPSPITNSQPIERGKRGHVEPLAKKFISQGM
jgi:hypothetical protein